MLICETPWGSLSSQPHSGKLHWGGGEAERRGDGQAWDNGRLGGKREHCEPEKKQQWLCLLPGELESLQIKSSGKAKGIINSSTLESDY